MHETTARVLVGAAVIVAVATLVGIVLVPSDGKVVAVVGLVLVGGMLQFMRIL